MCALAILYLLVVTAYTIATPYAEAPDESLHLRYIEYMERHHEFPPIGNPALVADSFHPPLYYTIGAGIIIASRKLTGYPELLTRLGPLQNAHDPSATGQGGPFASFAHPPSERWLIWPFLLRIPSILMGLGSVLLTYLTARALVPPPAPGVVPVLATVFSALIPQADFIRGSISNSNLSELIGAWIVFLLVLHLVQPYSRRRVLWLGVALGLGLLTKFNVGLLALPIVWAFWVRRDSLRAWLRDSGIVALLAAVIAGWYFVWRTLAYGDPLALTAWHQMFPPDNIYKLSDLFWFQEPFRGMLWTSFWGVFGNQAIWMPDWIYNAFTLLTLLAIVGGVILLARRALSRGQQEACAVMLATLVLMYFLVIGASTYLVAWQGREMYPALSSVCILLSLGLGALVLGPKAVQTVPLTGRARGFGTGLVATMGAGLLVLNIYAIGWFVIPGLN